MEPSSKPRQAKLLARKPHPARTGLASPVVPQTHAILPESHPAPVAMSAMSSGRGNADLMICLLRTVYLCYLLHEAAYGRTAPDLFREAEEVLQRSVMRADRNEGWIIPAADSAILEVILTLHEQQLASMPSHALRAARVRLQRYVATNLVSPISPEKAAASE